MNYKMNFDLYDFETWNGATDTKNTIINANKVDEFNDFIEEVFFNSIPTETEINDFLWFHEEYIYHNLGINEYLTEFNLETFPAKGANAIEVKRLLLEWLEHPLNTHEEIQEFLKITMTPYSNEDVNDLFNEDPNSVLHYFQIDNPYFEYFDFNDFETSSVEAEEAKQKIINQKKADEFVEYIQDNIYFELDYIENNKKINDLLAEKDFIFSELEIEL